MPIEFVKPGEPALVHQVARVAAEGMEVVPYAVPYVPPFPMLAGAGVTNGVGSTITTSADTPSSSQVPDAYDLEWTAGDNVAWEFFFDGVCWTPDVPIPSPLAAPWERTAWMSQVRFPQATYSGYWWPPVRPYGALLFQFAVTAEWLESYQALGAGTMVTLHGKTNWPGAWAWDLQSMQYPDPLVESYETRTWLAGKATVGKQVTVPGTWYYGDVGWHDPRLGYPAWGP